MLLSRWCLGIVNLKFPFLLADSISWMVRYSFACDLHGSSLLKYLKSYHVFDMQLDICSWPKNTE